MNKTQACKLASEQIGRLFPIGGQWAYHWHSIHPHHMQQSIPTSYENAQIRRRLHLIERAMNLLHSDEEILIRCEEPGDYAGGKWQSYVH